MDIALTPEQMHHLEQTPTEYELCMSLAWLINLESGTSDPPVTTHPERF